MVAKTLSSPHYTQLTTVEGIIKILDDWDMTIKILKGAWDASVYDTYGVSSIVMPEAFYGALELQLKDETWVEILPHAHSPEWYVKYKADKVCAEQHIPPHVKVAAAIAASSIYEQMGELATPVSTMCWRGAETMPWHTDTDSIHGDRVDCQLLVYFGDTHTAESGGMVQFRTPAGLYAEHHPHNRSSVLHTCEHGYQHRPVAHTGLPLDRILINFGFSLYR